MRKFYAKQGSKSAAKIAYERAIFKLSKEASAQQKLSMDEEILRQTRNLPHQKIVNG